MTSRFTELAVDCHDPERLAAFWCEVLDFKVIDRSEGKVEIGSWVPNVEDVRARQMPPTLLFVQVPEGRTVKNRLHLDVSPIDGSTEDEVTRLLGLGATRTDVARAQTETGLSWQTPRATSSVSCAPWHRRTRPRAGTRTRHTPQPSRCREGLTRHAYDNSTPDPALVAAQLSQETPRKP